MLDGLRRPRRILVLMVILTEAAPNSLASPNGWYGIAVGLAVLGWNVYNGVADRKRKVLVRQVGSSIENVALACGEFLPVIYLIRVSITNDSPRRPVTIATFGLSLPWKDDDLDLLPDPAEAVGRGSEYVLPGSGLWGYSRDWILNHRVNDQGRLDVGANLCGGLLFRGVQPIPDDFYQGQQAGVVVTVYLQDGSRFSAMCELRIDKGFEARIVQPPGADLSVG